MLILISGRLHRRLAGPRTGLTLVELLTVIAVISILISILIPTVSTVRISARKAKAKIILSQWAAAIETFRQEYGFYPAFSFNTDGLIDTATESEDFVKALTGREIDGSALEALDTASGNKKRISFYTFSEGEIDENDRITDEFENILLAVLIDKNYDGIIKVGVDATDDYTDFPVVWAGVTTPPGWPTDGLRAGVAIYSPGPDKNNIITTW